MDSWDEHVAEVARQTDALLADLPNNWDHLIVEAGDLDDEPLARM